MERTLAAAGLVAVCMLSTPVVGAAPPTPIKDFVRDAEFERAKISPTGRYLAMVMPREGRRMLGILDLELRKVTAHMRWDYEEVAAFHWVGPDRVVVSMARSFGPLDQPYLTGELFAMNADGSRKKYLFGQRGDATLEQMMVKRGVETEYASAEIIDPLPHESDWALISVVPFSRGDLARPLIERINVHTGARERLAIVPGFGPIDAATDRDGRVLFAYSNDESRRYHLYARTGDRWDEVQMPEGSAGAVELHGATADGSTVFLTTHATNGRACLREFRTATKKLVERICGEGVVGRPVFNLDRTAVVAMAHDAGLPEMEFIDLEIADARLFGSLRKTFKNQRIEVTSKTLDLRKIVILVSSDRNPGDLYLVDRTTKKVEYLTSRRAWIDPERMAPTAAVTYRTRDGATVHAYLTSKNGDAARKAPLVVMPHGGPHGIRDSWDWNPWVQALAQHGYAVLQVNFRGSGGYGYAHEAAGYRNWGKLMQDDLTDAVRWTIDRGIADATRICIMGASYGGYAALMSVVREPDLYRCAIGLAGVYDLASHAKDSDIAMRPTGRQYLEEVLGDDAMKRAQSPLTFVDRLKVPVLIAHGTADKRVPFNQAKLLREALDRHDKPYEWLAYNGEEHGLYVEANRIDFLQKAIAFLDKRIGKTD